VVLSDVEWQPCSEHHYALFYYAIKDGEKCGSRIPVYYAEFSKREPKKLDDMVWTRVLEFLRHIGLPGITPTSNFCITRVEVPLLNHRRVQS